MSRPPKEVPLVRKVARAFAAVGKLQRRGRNASGAKPYPYTRASDVLEAVRDKLLSQDVLILPNEAKPDYVDIGPSNGGPNITECRIAITYVFKDCKEELPPMTINGEGQCTEGKALYKAQTGAQKALLKRFGLMVEEADDPEFDGEQYDGDAPLLDTPPPRMPASQQPVTHAQRRAFADTCAASGKTEQEILDYLFQVHHVSNVSDLKRGKPFTEAIRWASNAAGLPAPKPQAAPAYQGTLPLPAPPIELRIGNQTVSFAPEKKAYSV